jgi:hypothetical protein
MLARLNSLGSPPDRTTCFGMIFILVIMAASNAHAITVNYTLDSVMLDDGTQMTGAFSWTFDVGNFENGVGQFSSLVIPWTEHNQDDLDVVFDIGSSIEITLAGSVHDDGVDITLFLSQPLTPTMSASIDLVRSKYEIGGNGFHDGSFLSGSISPATPVPSVSFPGHLALAALLMASAWYQSTAARRRSAGH